MREPVCLAACVLYATNRWLVKPHVVSPFLRGHFNDLLLIPCALPLLLWLQRRLGLRNHDRFPSSGEIALHLVVWAAISEFIGPRWLHHGVGDPWDVVAYLIGAIAAAIIWRAQSGRTGIAPDSVAQ